MIDKMEGQISLFDQDSSYGKTYQERSRQTKAKTSASSSKRSAGSKIRMPLFLDLTNGQHQDASWQTDTPWHGEYSIHSFGELPTSVMMECQLNSEHHNGVEESLLSQILVGGGAPEILFERKSVSGDIETFSGEGEGATEASQRDTGETISFQERSGKPGGGKGILIQTEHTGALSTLNNQSVLTHTHTHTSGRILYRRWADAPTVPAEQGRYAELYERTAESVDKREREKVGTLMAGDYKGVTSNQDIRQGLDKLVLEPIRNCGTGNTQKTK